MITHVIPLNPVPMHVVKPQPKKLRVEYKQPLEDPWKKELIKIMGRYLNTVYNFHDQIEMIVLHERREAGRTKLRMELEQTLKMISERKSVKDTKQPYEFCRTFINTL